MNTDRTVEGRTILITGANRGLGRALLEEALRRGAATVYAASRTPFQHPDERVVPLTVDLRDPDSLAAAAQAVPTLDLLVNNAGIGILGDDLTDVPLLQDHLQVNLLGPMALTNLLVPALGKTRGRIVNVGSIAGLANLPVMPSYSISKAAATSLTQAQRSLLARHGIRVHLVLAGPIDTDMVLELTIPKTAPQTVAAAILDGVMSGQEEIFPDPLSVPLADVWDAGITKTLERNNAALLPAPDYTTTFTVSKSPAEVFAAINDPHAWWDGEITGPTDHLGAEFTYRYRDHHMSLQRVVDLVPGERVVWEVLSSELDFVDEAEPWTGTRIAFDIEPVDGGTRVTLVHHGLVPLSDCYDACSTGWEHIAGRSLREFIETGHGVSF